VSVTGEFERYLIALIDVIRDNGHKSDRPALLERLEDARPRPDRALEDRAAQVLDALESHPEQAPTADADDAKALRRGEVRESLSAISRIILGR
jgi:hypothetical protein